MSPNETILHPKEATVTKAEIVRFEERIEELERLLVVERSKLERLRAAVASHKLLPRELLGKIFHYAVEGTPLEYPPSDFSVATHWTIRRTCSRWRDVAESDPFLWDDVQFDASRWSGPPKHLAQRFEFWRCQINHPSRPLSLSISGKGKPDITDFFRSQVVRQLSQRVKHLRLGQDFLDFLWPVYFPALERVEVPVDCNWPRTPRYPDFSGMPNLHMLSLKVSGTITVSPHIESTVHQLTHLSILPPKFPSHGAIELRTVLAILKMCGSLITCELDIATPYSPIAPHTIALLHLLSLRLTQPNHGTSRNPNTLLNFLVAPSLVELDVESYGSEAIQLSEVRCFIQNSGSSLCSFRMKYPWRRSHDPTGIDQLLALVPSVHKFDCPNTFVCDITVNKIADGLLLPYITELAIYGLSMDSARILIGLMETRWANHLSGSGTHLLRSLKVTLDEAAVNRDVAHELWRRAKACNALFQVRVWSK
ncbi:hypothetical protein DXG01_005273 [Tephrocybe rancida]|nr:hypothetical protein DXG01_005273 [Tephrocybe rancida]